jgi:hypothetical protein
VEEKVIMNVRCETCGGDAKFIAQTKDGFSRFVTRCLTAVEHNRVPAPGWPWEEV